MAVKSILTKIVLAVAAVYCVVTLLSLQGQITDAESNQATLSRQVSAAALENEKLRTELAQSDEQSTEDIARSELGLVSDGEILFYDSGN